MDGSFQRPKSTMGKAYRALNVPATSAPLTFAQTSALGRGRSHNKALKRESAHKQKARCTPCEPGALHSFAPQLLPTSGDYTLLFALCRNISGIM